MSLTVEDKFLIQELAIKYNHAVDSGDAEAFAALFTEDAVFREGHGDDLHIINEVGRENILRATHAAMKNFRPGIFRHTTTSHLIWEQDGRVYGESYNLLVSTRQSIHSSSRYVDEYRKVDGRWLFSKRRAYCDGSKEAWQASMRKMFEAAAEPA